MNDMELMYGVIIDRIQDGHKKYYRYAVGSKTMAESGPSQEEMDCILEAAAIMKRFEGVPQFDWLDDLEKKLYTTSKLGSETQKAVSFQHNQYLTGIDKWYKPIFEAIVAKKVIEINYHPFGKDVRTVVVSPYHLKQYNNRWFLVAKRKDFDKMSNYAIDRIEGIKETTRTFEPLDNDFDFEEFFSDVVGVSVVEGAPVENVILHVTDQAWNYITTKPLHESQSVLNSKQADGKWEVRLKVQDNYELRSLLRSFGDSVEVMAPVTLRQEMKEMAQRVFQMYKD
ncbi:WYL domain-containing protein [Phocaeicola dorei]